MGRDWCPTLALSAVGPMGVGQYRYWEHDHCIRIGGWVNVFL